MFTASISGRDESFGSRWARIQSRPQTYHESRPEPLEFRIRTAQRRTPGATPTTPHVLSFAPTVPATWVPWPFSSYQRVRSDVLQLYAARDVQVGVRSDAGIDDRDVRVDPLVEPVDLGQRR